MAWHSIKEAAPLIGLSVTNVYLLIESRRLAHRRIGVRKGSGKIRISDEAIAAFLRSCEVRSCEAGDEAPSLGGGTEETDGRPVSRTVSGASGASRRGRSSSASRVAKPSADLAARVAKYFP